VEIFSGEDMLLEIFIDDPAKTNEVALYKNNLDLNWWKKLLLFKNEIPWEFKNQSLAIT